MKEMEFEKFIEPLQESLEVHRKSQQNKKEQKEAKAKAKKAEEEKTPDMPEEESSEVTVMDTSEADKENGEQEAG